MNLVLVKTFPWCAMFYIVFLTLKADCCLQAFAIVKAVLKLGSFMNVESSTASRQETSNISSLVPAYLAAVGAEEGRQQHVKTPAALGELRSPYFMFELQKMFKKEGPGF